MPKAQAPTQATQGTLEDARIMLLSELITQVIENENPNVEPFSAKVKAELKARAQILDMIVVAIPDTGKAQFNGSHEIKSGKSAGKMSKATFVIAELGSSFAGLPVPYCQSQGDVDGLPLSLKLSVVAQPPNRDATTIDEALNRTPKLVEAVKTGTNG